jgi:hypothetical protein
MSTKTLQIDPANLHWLEAQTGGRRTLSEALNEILAALRKGEPVARGRAATAEELAAAYEALGEDAEACDVEPFWGAQAEAGRSPARILAAIRDRRSFSPTAVGAPDSTTLLREDRDR